jgi:hypothetical protein
MTDRTFTGASGLQAIRPAAGAIFDVSGSTVDTELPAAAALSDAVANPTTPMVGASVMGWDPVSLIWRRGRADQHGLFARGPGVASTTVSVYGTANAAATATLVAAGAGLFHNIVYLHISRSATAALAGTAVLAVTTTNLNLANVWRTGNLMVAGGYEVLIDKDFYYPIRSSVSNTNTTITCPAAGAAVLWTIIVHYFVSTQ